MVMSTAEVLELMAAEISAMRRALDRILDAAGYPVPGLPGVDPVEWVIAVLQRRELPDKSLH